MSQSNGSDTALRSYVDRIESLEEEIKGLQADRSEVYKEAKDDGFDPKIIREIVKERKLTAQQRREREELLDTYRKALGMLADSPLGEAAMRFVDGLAPGSGISGPGFNLRKGADGRMHDVDPAA